MKNTLRICVLITSILTNTNLLLTQWEQTGRPIEVNILSLAVSGSEVFAGTESGVYFSVNNGANWYIMETGLSYPTVSALVVNGTNLLAGTEHGIFVSKFIAGINGSGSIWTWVGDTPDSVRAFAVLGTNLFAATWGKGILLSTNNGSNWTAADSGLGSMNVSSLAVMGRNILAGTDSGIFLSTNNGESWAATNSGLGNMSVSAIVANGTSLFVGTRGGVFFSNDSATSWTSVNSGFTDLNVISFAVSGTNVFAGTTHGGVFLSTNNGQTWSTVNSGLTNLYVNALISNGQNLFAGTIGGGAFVSSNSGTNWASTYIMTPAVCVLGVNDTNMFAGTGGGGVFRSTDNGNSWTAVNSGLVSAHDHANCSSAIQIGGGNVFVGTQGGLYLSTNNGQSWKLLNGGGWFNCNDASLALSGTNLFAGTNDMGICRSTDNGSSWARVYSGMPTNTPIRTLAISYNAQGDTNVFAGTQDSGMYVSTNNGVSWSAINNGLPNDPIYSFAVSGTNLFAGTLDSGVFLSTNNGANWNAINNGLTSFNVKALAVSGSSVFAGTIGFGGVFLSTNNGQSWALADSGLPSNVNIQTLAVNDEYLFAGLATPAGSGSQSKGSNHPLSVSGSTVSGVWKRPLSEMITAVKGGVETVPSRFALQQNYPNPFNPATTISFTLPSRSYASLKVFDLIGREIATIFSEEMSAGTYSKRWNAENMSSGIYFYRLQAGTFTETKKLLLLK